MEAPHRSTVFISIAVSLSFSVVSHLRIPVKRGMGRNEGGGRKQGCGFMGERGGRDGQEPQGHLGQQGASSLALSPSRHLCGSAWLHPGYGKVLTPLPEEVRPELRGE